MKKRYIILFVVLIATMIGSWQICMTYYGEVYSKGVADGVGHGYSLRDPTYHEVMIFLSLDQTDKNDYNESYTCIDFAVDFKNHALIKGYNCGLVVIYFQGTTGSHALNCFNTTDRGLIFIETQTDQVVSVHTGHQYFASNRLTPPEYDDTVTRYVTAW